VCKALPPDRTATDLGTAAKLLTEALAKGSYPFAREALAGNLAEVSKGLTADRAATYLLHGLALCPEFYAIFISPLSEASERSSLQDAVGVLKHPLCYEEARLLYLRRVEQLTGRQFKNRWEMAAWLTKHHPETDPSSPAQRMD
jgi:hypothetical protein